MLRTCEKFDFLPTELPFVVVDAYNYLEKTLLRSSACIEESTFQSGSCSENTNQSFIKLCSWNSRNEPTALANVLQQCEGIAL